MFRAFTRLSYFWIIFFSGYSLAEEKVPEVGKHVVERVDAVSMIFSLLMVLVIIVVAAFILKRFQGMHNQLSDLRVITSLPLGSKEKILVVEVDNQQLLLGVTAQQISLLHTLQTPITTKQSDTQRIAPLLAKFLKQKSENGNDK